MVLGLGRQAAHLDDLPWISVGALQYLLTEFIEMEITQLETIGGGFEQSRSWRGGTWSTLAGFQNSLASAPKLKASREAAKRAMPRV